MRTLDTPAIEAKGLSIAYRTGRGLKKLAVSGLSFGVGRGEIVGFIGPNGAGKTSAIKAILGLIPSEADSCRILGIPSSDPRSRISLGYLPEISYYPRFLRLSEFLYICAWLSGVPKRERKDAVRTAARRTGMTEHLHSRMAGFSKGMLQQSGIAQALLHNPDILILDEPMSGLDPIARMKMRELLVDLRSEGKTILFSSHELGEIEMVADRILVLSQGRLLYDGAVSEAVSMDGNLERAFIRLLEEELPCAA